MRQMAGSFWGLSWDDALAGPVFFFSDSSLVSLASVEADNVLIGFLESKAAIQQCTPNENVLPKWRPPS